MPSSVQINRSLSLECMQAISVEARNEPIVQVTKHPDPVPVEDGGHWGHNPREDLGCGRKTEAEDPELERLSCHHEAKVTNANRDELGPEGMRRVATGKYQVCFFRKKTFFFREKNTA